MAYREVGMMDIDQVIRRWLAGENIRAIARSTGTDRNTVRRIVRLAEEGGIQGETPWPDEGKLQQIRQRMGRPGAAVASSGAEQQLKPRTEQIRAWLDKDHLLLTKVHELLGREGLLVSYSALYRFARKWCGFGTPSISVRRAESLPGEWRKWTSVGGYGWFPMATWRPWPFHVLQVSQPSGCILSSTPLICNPEVAHEHRLHREEDSSARAAETSLARVV